MADLRLKIDGVAVEITMPGGRGFVDGALKDVPIAPAATSAGVVGGGFAQQQTQPQVMVRQGGQQGMGQGRGQGGDSMGEGGMGGNGVGGQNQATSSATTTTTGTTTQQQNGILQQQEKSRGKDLKQKEEDEEDEDEENEIRPSDFVVTSNRVGYFYSGVKNKPPLVNVGDKIEFNKPVCVIEQLGQQYVYKSEVSGMVVNVFVEDGDPVQYDQKIMVIRPE